MDALDYPFAERFGSHAAPAQAQALRVLRFDTEVRRFLAANPEGTVVALGEGLETQFWRGRGVLFRYVAPLPLRLGLVEVLRIRAGD